MQHFVFHPPQLSVLMTAYNRERYIAQSIESILHSTFTDFELIIVDDCSTDNTLAIAEKFALQDQRIKVYQNNVNLGDYPNRNRAAQLARGIYLKYVDSDDMIYPDTLFNMVRAMEQFPEAALGISARDIDEDLMDPVLLLPREAFERHFYKEGFLDNGPLAVIIRRSVFEREGGFSPRRMVGDVELWLRLAELYPIIRLPKNMVYWRRHPEQEFNSGFTYYLIDGLQVYAEAFNRSACPLTAGERKTIFNQKKSAHLNSVFRYTFASLNLLSGFKLYRRLKEIHL